MDFVLATEDRVITKKLQAAADKAEASFASVDTALLTTTALSETTDFEILIIDLRQPGHEVASFLDIWSDSRDEFDYTLIPILDPARSLILVKKYRFRDFIILDNDDVMAAKLLSLQNSTGKNVDIIKGSALSINLNSYEVRVDDEPISLTYREFELLKHLVENEGKAFSRDDLLEKIWDYDYFGGTRTVDVHVQRLRAKLGPRAGLNIRTVRGVGYMYRAD